MSVHTKYITTDIILPFAKDSYCRCFLADFENYHFLWKTIKKYFESYFLSIWIANMGFSFSIDPNYFFKIFEDQ